MVIGFDASRAFLEDKTGTENYSFQLLQHLAKIDTQNQYLIYIKTASKIDTQKWPNNFKFIVIKYKRFWTQIGLSLRTFTDNLDLLFVPSHTLPIIRKPSLKTIMTVHDLGVEYLPNLHQLKQLIYLKWITKYQIKSATKLIAVSNSTKKDIISKIKVDEKNIKVIYEGVNETFKPLKNDLLINILNTYELDIYNYYLFVGTIQPRKNIVNIIKGYNNYFGSNKKAPKLILVGSKGWLSDKIYNLPSILNLTDRVKFIGRISDKDLNYLYSGAIALVFPSLFEGFGLPILEAFACGCPVITSNNSSLPEVGGKAVVYANNPNNPNDIGLAMYSLLSNIKYIKKYKNNSESIHYEIDLNKRKFLIERGLNQLKKFSWDKCAAQTLDLFNKTVNG